MKLESLQEFCKGKIKSHPNLKDDIIMIYRLAEGEVASGSVSEHHECSLAVESINNLIDEA